MKIKRSPFQIIAFFSAVLIGLTLLMPARAFATGSADSVERWNIAMTDFSAGLPPPGRAAAAAMLGGRANEAVLGALGAPYTPGPKPGASQPPPPTNITAGAGWAALRAFGVRSSAQFRAPRPYSSLRSIEYAMDVNEIAVLGKAGVSARSSDQTAIAFFWYENSSFAWNRIARKLSGDLSLMQHARLYAALNAAISDAYSTSLESKFYYNFWRPLTAIRAADTDDNPLTVKDPFWEPAFVTPPVPDYPSGHAAAGAAAGAARGRPRGRAPCRLRHPTHRARRGALGPPHA